MAEQKPTNRERVKEIVDGIEQNIQELFQSEKYFDYLRTMSRFHSYSVNNTILIHMQRPNAAQPVAGFQKWKQFGRHVKKGEKGLTIIAPTPLKKKIGEMKLDPDTKAPVLDQDGNAIIEEKTIEIPLFKPVKVFSADQTDGKPLPSLSTDLAGNVDQYEAFMEALRRTSPMPIVMKPLEPSLDGLCDFSSQIISVREGMSEVQTVCATVHEIAHAVLHNREQDRLSAAAGTDKEPPKAKDNNTKEVEAESVSFAVCQYYGIDTSENSLGYIATWSKDRSLPELKASLETINKAVSGLISSIDKHFVVICKERGIDLTVQQAEQDSPTAVSDTPEQFAADLYDFMAPLHQAGVLEHPFTLDPREQSITDLVAEMQAGHFDGVRDPLAHIAAHTDLPKGKTLIERMNLLAADQEDWTSAGTHFVTDFFSHLDELSKAGLIPTPYPPDKRDSFEKVFLKYFFKGDFSSFHHVLDDTAEKANMPSTAVLRNRLEKLSDRWDAALVCKIEPFYNFDSGVDRSVVHTYANQDGQLVPGAIAFSGTLDQCQSVVAGLEHGTLTLRQVRQPDFEPPVVPELKYIYKETEALFLVDDAVYLHVQATDEGWDYTLYEKERQLQMDGGLLNAPDLSIKDVAARICQAQGIGIKSIQPVSMELLETLQDTQAVPPAPEQSRVSPWLDTKLDEYPRPDAALVPDDLVIRGYTGHDILPLTRDRAAELLDQDMTIYIVRANEDPKMLFDQDDLMAQPEGMMYAVPCEEWEASPDFQQAVADRMQHQEDRERAFLDHGGDCFAIYQVKDDPALRDIRFESMDWLKSKGRTVERANYDLIYTAPLSAPGSVDATLDQLWNQFNNEHPADYLSPSASVSDILAVKRDSVVSFHYCNSFGFQQLPDFIKPENYLKNAEMSTEDDYGMIDGIINNGPKEGPSVAELEAQVKAGQTISLMDLADAVHREQGEKKSVLEKLNTKPPRRERKKSAPKKSAERER